ncbi:hypothetical protein [Plastoroseomonas hellenica]|uniref:hypothetical protein n=1 Tax=Plastoroseomonas hellenica TaxID=2687306 RepID=UPI001BAA8FCA|nr:hypothetical protein [Plastoroseomonas hellenica]MBR0646881.1 hypothetical protein [Plastoroseomonas hellenica]
MSAKAEERRIPLLPILLISVLLVYSRRPDAFLNAQFWAEDGLCWYREAHAMRWFESLIKTQNGYYQTTARTVGLLAQAVELRHAPLFFNVIGLFFQTLPVLILCSARGREIIPSRAGRLLASFLYLALPGSAEVHVNVTNIQWHLALSALILLMLPEGEGWRRWADLGLVILSGLSGPFAVMLLPIALVAFWLRRTRHSAALAGVLAVCCAVQGLAMFDSMAADRAPAPRGASLLWFARIVCTQVLAQAVAGTATDLLQWAGTPPPAMMALPAMLLAAALTVLALLRGPVPLKLLIIFAAMVLAASLASPQISMDREQWPALALGPDGSRYSFFPLIAWIAVIGWLAVGPVTVPLRVVGLALMAALMMVAIPRSWALPPFEDFGFARHAEAFTAAAPGTAVQIPINPAGWVMVLLRQ